MTQALTINAEAMAAVVSKAILEGISSEQRDLLLEQAVTALVTPVKPPGSYSSTPATTPLQDAFARAAQACVNKVAMEMVEENPEFVQRVRDLIGEAIAVASEQSYDLKDKVGHAVADALITWKRDGR